MQFYGFKIILQTKRICLIASSVVTELLTNKYLKKIHFHVYQFYVLIKKNVHILNKESSSFISCIENSSLNYKMPIENGLRVESL